MSIHQGSVLGSSLEGSTSMVTSHRDTDDTEGLVAGDGLRRDSEGL
ncbi:MAG: hypothetical protein RIT28_2417 [Pseudomonadota bacterium]